jgi:hypothetical protein
MRQHPLLAFATAASTLSLTLFAAVGSVGAVTTDHSPSTTASRSALLASTTPASASTLAALVAPAEKKPSRKAPKRSKPDTQGRRDVRVSKDVLVKVLVKVSIERHGVVPLPLSGIWSQLRSCESGGNYSDDTGNGYYGAYQFALSTWRGLALGGLPSSASPEIQDAAAVRLQRLDGWNPWPNCSWALGIRE